MSLYMLEFVLVTKAFFSKLTVQKLYFWLHKILED